MKSAKVAVQSIGNIFFIVHNSSLFLLFYQHHNSVGNFSRLRHPGQTMRILSGSKERITTRRLVCRASRQHFERVLDPDTHSTNAGVARTKW